MIPGINKDKLYLKHELLKVWLSRNFIAHDVHNLHLVDFILKEWLDIIRGRSPIAKILISQNRMKMMRKC